MWMPAREPDGERTVSHMRTKVDKREGVGKTGIFSDVLYG